jgi:hypothetical protein
LSFAAAVVAGQNAQNKNASTSRLKNEKEDDDTYCCIQEEEEGNPFITLRRW